MIEFTTLHDGSKELSMNAEEAKIVLSLLQLCLDGAEASIAIGGQRLIVSVSKGKDEQ